MIISIYILPCFLKHKSIFLFFFLKILLVKSCCFIFNFKFEFPFWCLLMSDLFRIDQFKLHVASRPDDQVSVGRVVQQCEQELPELQRAAALIRQTLLLHFTCLQSQTGKHLIIFSSIPPKISAAAIISSFFWSHSSFKVHTSYNTILLQSHLPVCLAQHKYRRSTDVALCHGQILRVKK